MKSPMANDEKSVKYLDLNRMLASDNSSCTSYYIVRSFATHASFVVLLFGTDNGRGHVSFEMAIAKLAKQMVKRNGRVIDSNLRIFFGHPKDDTA